MKKLTVALFALLTACGEGDQVRHIDSSLLVHCEEQVDGKGERWCYKDTMQPVEGTYQYSYDDNTTWTVKYENGHMRNIIVATADEPGFYRMSLIPEGERQFMVYSYLPGYKDSSATCGYSTSKVNRLVDCGGVEFQDKASASFLCPATFDKAAAIPGCRIKEDAQQ